MNSRTDFSSAWRTRSTAPSAEHSCSVVRSAMGPWLRNIAKSSVPRCCGKPVAWPRFIRSRFWPQLSSGPPGGSGGKFHTSGEADMMVMPSGAVALKCTNHARCVTSSTGVLKNTVLGPPGCGAQMMPNQGMTKLFTRA
jgi:hypothetical protein